MDLNEIINGQKSSSIPGAPVGSLPAVPAQQTPVHHRPPAVEYREGVPYYVGQPYQQQPIVVRLPEHSEMSPAQRALMLNVVLLLVVAVVLCGCVAGLVVVCGGTLMGIIGTVGANAVPIGLTTVGTLLAAGWLLSKAKGLTGRMTDDDKNGR
jgi:hypothetical protein